MLGCFPWDAIYKVRHKLKNQNYNIYASERKKK